MSGEPPPKPLTHIHVYLDSAKAKTAEGQPFNAGISGATVLDVLEKADGAGILKDPEGVVVTKEDQNLLGGDYQFSLAGGAASGSDPGSHARKQAQTPSEATKGFADELLGRLEWVLVAVDGLTQSELKAIPSYPELQSFPWQARREDDQDLLKDVQQRLQADYLPDGITAVAVTDIKWLYQDFPAIGKEIKTGKTDFVFVDSDMLTARLSTLEPQIVKGDTLRALLPGILGLLELKQTNVLAGKRASSCAQAQTEYVAIAHMSPLPAAAGIDVPVILTDMCSTFIYQRNAGHKSHVIELTVDNASCAAAHIKQMLTAKHAIWNARRDDIRSRPGPSMGQLGDQPAEHFGNPGSDADPGWHEGSPKQESDQEQQKKRHKKQHQQQQQQQQLQVHTSCDLDDLQEECMRTHRFMLAIKSLQKHGMTTEDWPDFVSCQAE